ncbi:myoD family inhibitor isoform X2 [Mus musculus]|uniref:MyoD family inhibitor n=4 Tax=Mus musculus TaxID=10090 RepID=MDFI_MOUSE|nr:myoD family inhibitor isoform X2 [Mus musculus]XP_006523807.1 myoD family inhibitor isoform X2 [Mus musculus]XP_006523808.1 myoD family inhibitor isoform X2 [Mus musculus]P70331.1 RecName: Full=MyoD family inhibitor; AltName: Full=Myogenic repressor I-mf [Mus musculus]AAC52792.1 inhibitor of MyoD family-b [Mus musculus]|eukprot:XP_006523806.1 PREDICTED: myoD family inhibitor isoform X2 [Mus musculus]
MSQVSGQCPSRCDAPHGVPSAALDPAQTMSLLPGLEVARSTHPVEASSEEGFPEEAAPSMPHDSGLRAQQALNSIDLDVPTEAVTCQPQGNPQGCTPLLPNGSSHDHLSEPGSAGHAGNGALGGSKAHRKLQTHPSLGSQAGRKSRGSARSASQVPLQAQEGKAPAVRIHRQTASPTCCLRNAQLSGTALRSLRLESQGHRELNNKTLSQSNNKKPGVAAHAAIIPALTRPKQNCHDPSLLPGTHGVGKEF